MISRPDANTHLSTTLAGLILSMTMTCLLLCVAVARVMPSTVPGDLPISTSRGPEAFVTVSAQQITHWRVLALSYPLHLQPGAVIITTRAGPPRLVTNRGCNQEAWIMVALVGGGGFGWFGFLPKF